jgi:hypothetical protein
MHIADYIAVLKRIKFLEWATATAVSLATLIVVTVILWWVKLALPGAISHPVFFYYWPCFMGSSKAIRRRCIYLFGFSALRPDLQFSRLR